MQIGEQFKAFTRLPWRTGSRQAFSLNVEPGRGREGCLAPHAFSFSLLFFLSLQSCLTILAYPSFPSTFLASSCLPPLPISQSVHRLSSSSSSSPDPHRLIFHVVSPLPPIVTEETMPNQTWDRSFHIK